MKKLNTLLLKPLGDGLQEKNLITPNATYENIVFMHDYLILDEKWYEGYLDFGHFKLY